MSNQAAFWFGSMKTVTFTLKNFPTKDFIHWLGYYTSRPNFLGFPSFPANNGQGEYLLWGAEFPDDIMGPTHVDVRVYYIEPHTDEGAFTAVLSGEVDKAPSSWPPRRRLRDHFYFDVIPCGADTEVIAWCSVPELMEFYKKLLEKLTESHPEAEEAIARALGTPIPQTPAEEGVVKSLGGAPPKADYDWAFQEIEKGRDQAEVYKEWLQRIPKDRKQNLSDPMDSFKQAMRYRRKRKKGE